MDNQHAQFNCETEKEYESLKELVASSKFGKSLPEVYFCGILARICETIESIFHNANSNHDNTLLILFRHLYENVVRLRFIALEPDKGAMEFQLKEMRGHLGIIGREDVEGETDQRKQDRLRYIEIEDKSLRRLKELYKTPDNKNPPDMSVERMCQLVNMGDSYNVYRLFSQFEHSTGVGLMGTVVNKNTNFVSIGNKFTEGKIEVFWKSVGKMIIGTREGMEMLNQNRPN